MALALSTANYTQFEQDFFITEALIGLDTLNKQLLYPSTGVKNDQYTFPQMVSTPLLQPHTLIPTDNSTTTLSNRNFTLGKFDVYEAFDPNIFENHWHKDQLTSRLLDRQLPATFVNYLGAYYTAKAFAAVEYLLHIGSTGYTTSASTTGSANYSYKRIDGIIRQAIVDGTFLSVASPSAITSGNVIAKMDAAIALLPTALIGAANRYDRLRFMMAPIDFQAFETALTTGTTYKGTPYGMAADPHWKGYKIETCSGIPTGTFYLCEATKFPTSNLHLAIGDMGDKTFKLDRLQNNSEAMFYKMEMKLGVGIAKMNEFIMHTTKVAGDFTA